MTASLKAGLMTLWSTAALTLTSAHAAPGIAGTAILDTQYTTGLQISTTLDFITKDMITTTQVNRSNAPLDNALQGTVDDYGVHQYAMAHAGMFSVSTDTKAFPAAGERSATARATAETMLTFTSLANQTVPLSFEFEGRGLYDFSNGFVSLYDRTEKRSIFFYGWTDADDPTRLPIFRGDPLELDPRLHSSHIYALTLHASTTANTDQQGVSIFISGLGSMVTSVPEPSTSGLWFAGLGAIGLASRRLKWRA